MLPVISKKDIQYAEKILFGRINVFDKERIDFIKDFNTSDLQAVPGSGKTTALLAKLLIIEKYLPLDGGSGVLVLSHTNTAVDEIKQRIGKHCPKLFSYPNFIGTIQSFVDQFLAIPYFKLKFKTDHFRIDDEIYFERIEQELTRCLRGEQFDVYRKVLYIKNSNSGVIFNSRFGINDAGSVILKKDVNGDEIVVKKSRGGDYSAQEKAAIYNYILKLKGKVLSSGVLCYDDAYFLGNVYLNKIPEIKKVLQSRFKLVFVDEMQDMDAHQYELLDSLFYKKSVKNHIFQRIGDKNQAIYSSNSASGIVWKDREKMLKFSGSQRLSPQIANAVKYFGINYIEIDGKNEDLRIPPVLIRFSNDRISEVLEKFSEIVRAYIDQHDIPLSGLKPIKAVGWSTSHGDADKFGILDYHGTYSRVRKGNKNDFENLKSYIQNMDVSTQTFKPIRDYLLNSLLKALRLENIVFENRYFTRQRLLAYLKDQHIEKYEELKLKIYEWSIAIINSSNPQITDHCSAYYKQFISTVFDKTELNSATISFLDGTEFEDAGEEMEDVENPNVVESNGLSIEIGTVHSVKGETHFATLYLETFYYKHETDKIRTQLLQNPIPQNANPTTKLAGKMMYVGFSRPTTVLVYASSIDRVSDEMKQEMMDKGWRVEDLISG